MYLKLLEEYIKNNDIDKAIGIISDMGAKKYKAATPILIKHLQSTDNNVLRNEIAIALSDIGCCEAVEPIMKMIKNPKTIGNRGTLLYALESFDCSSHIESLVDLLYDDNFEVSRQALLLIEPIVKTLSDGNKQKYIINIKNKIESLHDKIDFLAESLDVFEQE